MKPLKKIKAGKSNGMYALTMTSFLLIIWEMFIYRKTFISVFIPITVWGLGGFLFFLFLNTRLKYYKNAGTPFWARAFHGTFTFGAMLMFCFMALNYYMPISEAKERNLKVIKTNRFGARRGRTGDPYVIALHDGVRKQLVFPNDADVHNCISVNVKMATGLFGFETVLSAELAEFKKEQFGPGITDQYKRLKWKAEEYSMNGDRKKAIELYQRAVKLNPADTLAAKRLLELKAM
jgi:tetratricopeptide (TPR) repeat protein